MFASKVWLRAFSCGKKCLAKTRASALDSEQSELAMRFQSHFLYARRRPETVYHAHTVPAGILANELENDIKSGRYILEASPGPGILTRKLLQKGCKRLRVFEKNKPFIDELMFLKSKFPNLEVSPHDITTMAKMNVSDQLGGTTRLQTCLQGLPTSSWTGEPQMTLVATLGRHRECGFLRSLIYAIPSRTLIFQNGRVDLLLFVSGLEYKYMSATAESKNFDNYRYVSILYDLFFNIKFINEVPRTFFLPQEINDKKKVRFDKHDFYLVRLTPRKEIFGVLTPHNRLEEFVFFVRQCMARRSAPVIPTLEKFIPRVGVRLILEERLKVFTQMGELSPEKMLKVFKVFSSMEGYEHSGFISAYQAEKVRSYGFGFTDEE